MKKLFAVFLILMFAFSGCGTESTDVNKDVTVSPSPDKATVEKESKEENSETVAFELGTAENGVYKNNYLGIRCNLPEWEFSSREELDAELELASVILSGTADNTEYLESFEQADNYSDMKAVHPNGITNMNIIVANISEEASAISNMSEYAFLYLMSQELEKTFSEMGLENMNSDIVEVETDGGTKYALYCSTEIAGTSTHMMQMIHSRHNHRATITITGLSKEECLSVCKSLSFESE